MPLVDMSARSGTPAPNRRALNRRSALGEFSGERCAGRPRKIVLLAAWRGGSWADAGAAGRTGEDAIDLGVGCDRGGSDPAADVAGEFSGREGDAVGAALGHRQVEGTAVDGFRGRHRVAAAKPVGSREGLAGAVVADEVAVVEEGGEASPDEGRGDVAAVL